MRLKSNEGPKGAPATSWIPVSLLLVMFCGCFGGTEPTVPEPDLAPVDTDKNGPVEFVIVVDNSRSITSKEQGIVRETAKLLIDLVDPGDRVAVVSFDSSARIVASRDVQNDGDRTALQMEVDKRLDFKGNRSDIRAGLALLGREKSTLFPGKNATRVAIVLSDGRLEPADGKTAAALTEMKASLASQLGDVMVHAVVLGDTYCRRPVRGLPDGTTGLLLMEEDVARSPEHFFHARNLDQLLDTVVFILKRAKGLTSMGEEGAVSFRIDDTVDSIMLIVRKQSADGTILAQSDDIILSRPELPAQSDEVFYHNRDYTFFDLFLIRNPTPGIWEVDLASGVDPEVLSKSSSPIRLVVESEDTYYENEQALMRAWLQDDTLGAVSRAGYRLRMHWGEPGRLSESSNYVDLDLDEASGQYFLVMPGSLLLEKSTETPLAYDFEVVAQRRSPTDSLAFDEWFLRRSSGSSVTMLQPLIQWHELPASFTRIPFRAIRLPFGGKLNTDDPCFSHFDAPPRLSLAVEKWDDNQKSYAPFHDKVIESSADGKLLLFAEELEPSANGEYRYMYTLTGQTDKGRLSFRSPWFNTTVGPLTWLLPVGVGMGLLLMHVLGAVSARIKGRISVVVGPESRRISIQPARVFDSSDGFDRRLKTGEEGLKLAPVHFRLKAVRRMVVVKRIKLKMIAGEATIAPKGRAGRGDSRQLAPGKSILLGVGRPFELKYTDGGRQVVAELRVTI